MTFSEENREFVDLEWWTISDTKLTKIFSLKPGSTPTIHHDYRNILTGSGKMHRIPLNKLCV